MPSFLVLRDNLSRVEEFDYEIVFAVVKSSGMETGWYNTFLLSASVYQENKPLGYNVFLSFIYCQSYAFWAK